MNYSTQLAQLSVQIREFMGMQTVPEKLFTTYVSAFSSTLAISLAPFLMLFFVPVYSNDEKNQPLLRVFLSMAAGGLLGDAFLHLLPHAVMAAHENQSKQGRLSKLVKGDDHSHNFEESMMRVSYCILAGIFSFLVVEFFIRLVNGGSNHAHKNEPQITQSEPKNTQGSKPGGKKTNKKPGQVKSSKPTKPIAVAAYLNLVADFMHNFTDGLAIGSSFLAGETVGFVTTFTILLHEIPHEIGDFALLVESGYSKWKAIFLQLVTAVGAVSGCAVALFLQHEFGTRASEFILPFTAGGFVYIALVSIIGDLMANVRSFKQTLFELIFVLVGFGMMVGVTYIEHQDQSAHNHHH